MRRLQIDVPEQTLISLKTDSESFAKELALLAAVKLFEMGKLSSGRAAELAGLSRAEFLIELRRYRVSPFQRRGSELAELSSWGRGVR